MNKKDKPYSGLPSSAFWRSALVEKNHLQISDLEAKISINQKEKFIQPSPFPAELILYAPQWISSIYWRQFVDLTYSASIEIFTDIGIFINHPQELFFRIWCYQKYIRSR